jgi:AbrB family looped-hinge helix DNA binding protein
MEARLTIDLAGRVVIPKLVRDALHLAPGDMLELESAGERIVLRPVRAVSPLAKEKGVWVLRTGQSLPASAVDDLLGELREERDQQNLNAAP